MSLTLQYGFLNYFPRHVSSFVYPGEAESRIAVIYERRVPSETDEIWYRWGLNTTAALADIEAYDSDWDPVFVMGYTIGSSVEYMLQWERNIPY